jgi:hypothetical protein
MTCLSCGRLGDAVLPVCLPRTVASERDLPTMWFLLTRLSRSGSTELAEVFALPRDTTSWPVIGRASLPAKPPFEVSLNL